MAGDTHNLVPELRHSPRVKRLRITVHADARVVLSVPLRTSLVEAERFFARKIDWVRTAIERLRGRELKQLPPLGRRDYNVHKEAARVLVWEKLVRWNARYRCAVARVTIRCTRSRWGSCSARGNLNFSYRLVHLPEHLVDYVIVHELCHLKELNHSPRFWALVAETHPHHRALRRELANYR